MTAPRFHWLRLRATAHPSEDVERVKTALRRASGLADDAFEAALSVTGFEAYHGGKAWLLDVDVQSSRPARDWLASLPEEVRGAVTVGLDERVDEDGVLYVRLDKQVAYAGGRRLADGDDAIQCRIKPQVHPASRDGALAVLRQALAPPTPL